MCLFAAGLLYVLSTPIVSNAFFSYVEKDHVRQSSQRVGSAQAIVVLSGMLIDVKTAEGITQEWSDPDRFFAGVELFKANKSNQLIFTGGLLPWSKSDQAEGDVLRRYAIEMGIPKESIKVSGHAQNTFEEAKAVKALLGTNGNIILVTSSFHMPRAKLHFERAGFEVIPFAVDYKVSYSQTTFLDALPSAGALFKVDLGVREMIGRLYYQYLKKSQFNQSSGAFKISVSSESMFQNTQSKAQHERKTP
jgi:uncharacterized SAM-binding protein YcdF (DUF218 family)